VKDNEYRIGNMKRSDVDLAIEWAAQEGWNPGWQDAEIFFAADPDGFFIGSLAGEPISTISAVKYDNDFGFLGFYIVKPEYRGRGYGFKIWQKGLQYLKGCNIGLDGVIAQQDNYRKSGFKLAYRNIRYEGLAVRTSYSHPDIDSASQIPFSLLEVYERQYFPAGRNGFLQNWLNQNGGDTAVYFKAGEIEGYGVIRKCRIGSKIGPLFANSAAIADSIMQKLISNLVTGDKFYLDIPEVNEAAKKMVMKYRMKPVFETARMYTEDKPKIDLNGIFGVTSFELG